MLSSIRMGDAGSVLWGLCQGYRGWDCARVTLQQGDRNNKLALKPLHVSQKYSKQT